jgi:DNA uptake protein ComE-like DNA-binding protein
VSRLDPNTAPLEELATLPQLGEKRAREIVAYREIFSADHPGHRAFTQPKDLLKVKGIAYSMMQTLEPFLTFTDPSKASTQP